MCAVPEGQWCGSSAFKPELVGLVESRWITIGGGDDNESRLTASYFDISDELSLGCGTRSSLHGSIEPEQFVDQRRLVGVQAVHDAGVIWTGCE